MPCLAIQSIRSSCIVRRVNHDLQQWYACSSCESFTGHSMKQSIILVLGEISPVQILDLRNNWGNLRRISSNLTQKNKEKKMWTNKILLILTNWKTGSFKLLFKTRILEIQINLMMKANHPIQKMIKMKTTTMKMTMSLKAHLRINYSKQYRESMNKWRN